ncbi:unnamed protein product, partial [Rotaria magnacalcarata]
LLYVKDVESFTNLLDYKKWPITLDNNSFTVPSTPSIPPQLPSHTKVFKKRVKTR